MTAIDLTSFVEEYETAETRAYKHALEISYQIVEEMRAQGINQKELSQKMGVSPARLSMMLNTQPNMTLKSLAQFELALGISFDFCSRKDIEDNQTLQGVLPQPDAPAVTYQSHDADAGMSYSQQKDAPAPNTMPVFQIAA